MAWAGEGSSVARITNVSAKKDEWPPWANMLKSRIMARRPRPPDEILTREELEDLQRRLSKMSITAVQDFYQYTHSADCMFPGRFPTA